MAVMTVQGADGRNLPTGQPEHDTVTGSPFTVATGSATTVTGSYSGLLMIVANDDIKIRFSKDGTAADGNDFLLPKNQVFAFPMNADRFSMIAVNASTTVYAQMAKEI